MRIIEHEQGTPEWLEARRGVPSASRFGKIVTPKGKLSSQADGLINELIAEDLFQIENEVYVSAAMQHGIDTEPVARRWYELQTKTTVQEIGFCVHAKGFGCSPDGLIGDDGGVEIKCPQAWTHIGYLRDGGLPSQYAAQVHGSMIVTGRQWWDFVSYHEAMPKMLVRVERDEYTETLEAALVEFVERYHAERAKIAALAEGAAW